MDDLVKKSVRKKTDLFIKSISSTTVCNIASSYNDQRPCRIFSEPTKGSYNICYPVAFMTTGGIQKWVVRIPLEPRVGFVDEKLENEVAVMRSVLVGLCCIVIEEADVLVPRFIQKETTIPIPRLHGYATKKESQTGFAFMLTDYVEGSTLFDVGLSSFDERQRRNFYNRLADIYIQLRLHEFPGVGCLSPSSDGSGWTFDGHRRPLSIDMIEQEIEGLEPGLLVKPNDSYTSTIDYVYSLRCLAFNQFERGRNSVASKYDAEIALYNLHQFFALAMSWVNPEYNHGPFAMLHGDFRPQNILVDRDGNIISIIDWEWSQTVPVQLLIPPTWLTGCELVGLTQYFQMKKYLPELNKLREAVKVRESSFPAPKGPALSEIWSKIEVDRSFFIAGALLSLTSIDTIYKKDQDYRYHGKDLHGRAQRFISASRDRQDLVSKKVAHRARYLEELSLCGMTEEAEFSPRPNLSPTGVMNPYLK
ncbi:MAG: hypothetical protein M1839_004178 [Geoglossum umbratile]|nr:MAG: hypothetical protein M1839_004178 [Geoglossum umbratile]